MRVSALLGTLAFLAGAGLAGGAYTLGRTWRETSRDRFCSRCHEMEPFIAALKAGPHEGISCKTCHIGPGPWKALGDKVRGLVFLASHKGGVSGRPQGVVPDRACTGAGCHPGGGRDGIPWRGILFHHSQHRKTGRAVLGERPRCTLCHGTALERGHGTAVREESCLVCHLAGKGYGGGREEDRACLVCHGMPPTVELARGARLDHAEARARGYSCGQCHSSLFPQGPPVQRKTCLACHTRAAKDPDWPLSWDAGEMHRIHVLDSSLACRRCHTQGPHHLPSPWLARDGKKAPSCPHAWGRKKDGGPRAFVRVDCRFCHLRADGGSLREERCDLCHERKKK